MSLDREREREAIWDREWEEGESQVLRVEPRVGGYAEKEVGRV
jgi:hypothetical protein